MFQPIPRPAPGGAPLIVAGPSTSPSTRPSTSLPTSLPTGPDEAKGTSR